METILARFLETARLQRTDLAIAADDGATMTFGELDAAAIDVVRRLEAARIEPGDRVAILAPDVTSVLACVLGCRARSVVAAPFPSGATPRELIEAFTRLRPAGLLARADYLDWLRARGVVAAAGGVRSGARPSDARTPGTPSPGTAPRHAGPTEPAAFRGPIGIPLDAAPRWTRAGEAEPSDAPDPDLALLLPTCDGSGTTRLVPLRETRALTGIDAAIRLDDGLVRRGDTVLALMPPESSLGLVFAYLMPLLVGASVRHFERRPAAPELRRRLEEHAPEVLFAGAEMIRAIARDPDLAPEHVASIRSAVCGGSRLEPRIVERLRERHALHVCTWYGSAETLLVSANRTEDNRGDTVGRPVAGVSVAILGTDGSPLPAGQTGEIAVAGPSVLSRRDGYFGEGDAAATATTTATATAAAVDGEPFRTGDLGSLDAAGFLRFEGRRKPIAKVDGASVDLLEVRRVLLHIPGVENVRLDIRSDEVHGQRIDARLTMREPAESSSLEAVAREQLSSHKVPHSLVAVAADESAPPAATPPAATPSAATPRERGGDGCAGPESAL